MLLSACISLPLCYSSSAPHRDLHSFPTRRSSDLPLPGSAQGMDAAAVEGAVELLLLPVVRLTNLCLPHLERSGRGDRKSTRLNSSHLGISYAVFCLKKKKKMSICYNRISNPYNDY